MRFSVLCVAWKPNLAKVFLAFWREVWGTSLPSIIACSGFLLGIISALLAIRHVSFASFCILGIAMNAIAIRINLRRQLSVKWRKPNIALHTFFLVAIVITLIVVLLMKTKGMF